MDSRTTVITTLRRYEVSNDQKSLGIVVFTMLALLTSLTTSVFLYSIHPLFSLFLCLPSGFLLCRFFVIQHDCGHFSFFTKRIYNQIAGAILGFFTLIPSVLWNHIHDVHHGMVGNLNERKRNPELWTLTVEEYKSSSFVKRFLYRIFRSVIMRLFVTPIMWIIAPRIPMIHLGRKIFLSIIVHNILYAIIIYFVLINNHLLALLLIYLIPLYIFNFLASVFFYLQHQFEDTTWENDEEWNLYDASIHGSSHLVVGKFMGWVSGNVGCHHIHHLNTKIPSYLLFNATEEANKHLEIEPIYMNELFHHLRCILWDESSRKLIPVRNISKAKEK